MDTYIDYSKEIFFLVKEALTKNNCDVSKVALSQNISDDSIKIFNNVAMYISINKKGTFFIIPSELASQAQKIYQPFDILAKGVRFKFNSLAELDERFEKIIVFIYNTLLEQLSVDEFGCCSRYLECSDRKTCVNENIDNKNRKISTGCHYKKHLENGRIFYGKNANV